MRLFGTRLYSLTLVRQRILYYLTIVRQVDCTAAMDAGLARLPATARLPVRKPGPVKLLCRGNLVLSKRIGRSRCVELASKTADFDSNNTRAALSHSNTSITWARDGRKIPVLGARIEGWLLSKGSRINVNFAEFWGERWDLNPRPSVPQTDALPAELRSPQAYFTWVFFASALAIVPRPTR